MRQFLLITLACTPLALWSPAAPALDLPIREAQSEQQYSQQTVENHLSVRRNSSGHIDFLPLATFEVLNKMTSAERTAVQILDDEFGRYRTSFEQYRRFHSQRNSRDPSNNCNQLTGNHAEFHLVADDEIAAVPPRVSLADLVDRAEIAFVARIDSAEPGFRGTLLGTLVELTVLESLKTDALAPSTGEKTDYFIHSVDAWVDGVHLCNGWEGHYKETSGDEVLVLAGPTPTPGKYRFFNVFLITQDQIQPEPLIFLEDKPLDIRVVRP